MSSAWTFDSVAREDDEMERLIGGQDASEGQFPWATVLFYNDQFICSSSIIGPNTILTAAHCVVFNGVTEPAESFHAIANYRKSADAVRIDFASVVPHPNYTDSNGIQNDIAILTTTEPIPFSDTVQPICIARADTLANEYKTATAMGWGFTSRSRDQNSLP
ncbi:serine protease, partial [Corynebacterium sp. MC-21]|uniref:S1 family serine peptidase n=1 Tax=Corynebacterium parakroppenstedtii TaxID=2828363 RepID=UPI001F332EDF|nr:serine protease [Corynebacterium parakroppenstedtii]